MTLKNPVHPLQREFPSWEKPQSAVDAQALGLVPMVVETSGRGERAYDIYSRSPRPLVSTTIGTKPSACASTALCGFSQLGNSRCSGCTGFLSVIKDGGAENKFQ